MEPTTVNRSSSRSQPESSTETQMTMSVLRSDNTITEPMSSGDRQRLTNDELDNKPSQGSVCTTLDFAASVAHLGRRYALHQTRRLVQKGGECNVMSVNVTRRGRRYLADGFTTLVELRWRYQILLFVTQFVVSWTAFALVYYVLALVRGDITHYSNTGYLVNRTWTPCVNNVYDYTSALLYSLETQTTIGYGVRVINPSCRFGVFVLMLQTCFGTFIQALATGVIFAKISRPKGRARTLLFSRSAVICQRDGNYQLLFRVADMRNKSHIIGTSLRALMVRNRLTREGEQIPLCQYPLELDTETSPANDNFVFMSWPVTVVHYINESSPFWNMSAEQCLTEQYEIVVILEGIVESTGSSTQFRTSFLPSEIHWGERLAPLVTCQKGDGGYLIDYGQFHHTIPVSMPEYSARIWSMQREGETSDDRDDEQQHYPFQFRARISQSRTTGSRLSSFKKKRKPSQIVARFSLLGKSSRVKRTPEEAASARPQTTSSKKGRFNVWTVADPARPGGSVSRREPLARFFPLVNGEGDHNNNCNGSSNTVVTV